MLIVSSIDGSQVEPLTQHQGLKVEEEVNGGFTLSLTSFNSPDNPGHKILLEETFVTVDNHEFRVKQLSENQYSKTIDATHIYFDLADIRQEETFGGTHTVSEFAEFIFGGTGWTATSDVTESVLIENFGNGNVVSLVNALCTAFKCEYKILPNKQIHFSKQIGPDRDTVYRYKHNVIALTKKVDTTQLKTFIEGYGANELHVSYTSPLADKFGIREAEPIRDESFLEADKLTEHIKSQLTDDIEAYFELESNELLGRELGERVWLIYEPIDVEFQTRILKHTKEYSNGKLTITSVGLGNTKPKSTEDILISQKVEIDNNKKSEQSRFHQTNQRIDMEVEVVNESIAAVGLKADQIELNVQNLITSEIAGLNIRADAVETSVVDLQNDVNAQFTVMANQVSSKITSSDAQSIFTQSASSFTFDAEQINFNGKVFGQGAVFSGHVETSQSIKVGTNIEMQGNGGGLIRFPYAETWIGVAPSGDMTIQTWGQLNIVGIKTKFYSDVDFSSSRIDWGNNKPVPVWG